MLEDTVLYGLYKLVKGIGAIVFSVFSLFRVSPKEHYRTEDFDKKVGLFWTGFITLIPVIWFIVIIVRKLKGV
jgi:hypothetical protein